MSKIVEQAELRNVLPAYECHKIVRGAQITGVSPVRQDGHPSTWDVDLILGDVRVTLPYQTPALRAHWPRVGDYLVVYDDGYISVSPADAFEKGCRKIEPYETVEYANGMFAEGRAPLPREMDGSPAVAVNGQPINKIGPLVFDSTPNHEVSV